MDEEEVEEELVKSEGPMWDGMADRILLFSIIFNFCYLGYGFFGTRMLNFFSFLFLSVLHPAQPESPGSTNWKNAEEQVVSLLASFPFHT